MAGVGCEYFIASVEVSDDSLILCDTGDLRCLSGEGEHMLDITGGLSWRRRRFLAGSLEEGSRRHLDDDDSGVDLGFGGDCLKSGENVRGTCGTKCCQLK